MIGDPRRRPVGLHDLLPFTECVIALVLATASRECRAQTQQEIATRRLLLDQASAQRAAGNHSQALALALRAGEVRMTPSVRLFIAQEELSLGDPAGALGHAEQCVVDVERDRRVPNRTPLLSTCRELSQVARAQVGFVLLRAPDPVPEGLRVTVRSAPLRAALLGVPFVVSPGLVEISASAEGRAAFSVSRRIERGEVADITLSLPLIEPAPPAPVIALAPTPVAAPAPAPAPPIVVRPVATRRPSRLGPALLLASGAAEVAGGVALLFVREGALEGCTVTGTHAECESAEALSVARGANDLAAGAGALLGLGALCVTAGALWLVLDRGASASRVTTGFLPTRGGATAAIAARF